MGTLYLQTIVIYIGYEAFSLLNGRKSVYENT